VNIFASGCGTKKRSGVQWSGVEWSGVEWIGVDWSGMEWNGVEWSGNEKAQAENFKFYERILLVMFVHHVFCE
jgi:hypothetical protein